MRLHRYGLRISNFDSLCNCRANNRIVFLSLYSINLMLKLRANRQIYYSGSHIITPRN